MAKPNILEMFAWLMKKEIVVLLKKNT